MKRYLLAVLALMALFSACSAEQGEEYMYRVGRELMSILWDVDYNTFAPETSTQFAKDYYDSEFLEDYMRDPELKSGVNSIWEEKLVSRVLSVSPLGFDTETFEDGQYTLCRVQVKMYIDNYEPLYPDDTYFSADREFLLNYTLYFKWEMGKQKLSGFEFRPANEPFLPKSANNVPLTPVMQEKIAKLVQEYYAIRYGFHYKTFDVEKVYGFYQSSMTEGLLKNEEITKEYLDQFYKDITSLQMTSSIERIDLGTLPVNKEGVLANEEAFEFCYVVHASVDYLVEATDEYFEMTDTLRGEITSIQEKLCFIFEGEEPKLYYAEFE